MVEFMVGFGCGVLALAMISLLVGGDENGTD